MVPNHYDNMMILTVEIQGDAEAWKNAWISSLLSSGLMGIITS
jgi:hypothetical protein